MVWSSEATAARDSGSTVSEATRAGSARHRLRRAVSIEMKPPGMDGGSIPIPRNYSGVFGRDPQETSRATITKTLELGYQMDRWQRGRGDLPTATGLGLAN